MGVVFDGIVDETQGTIVVRATPAKKVLVTLMEFTNIGGAYNLTVSKYSSITKQVLPLYKLTLADEDIVTDDTQRLLNPDDYLIVESSIAGTTFIVTYQEIDS